MFENKNNTEYSDDLIKAGQEPIIIKQKDSGDKKFIYTILILLVILFIIALGVIFYLGSKFFNGNAPTAQQPATTVVQTTAPIAKVNNETKVEKKSIVQKQTTQEPKKVVKNIKQTLETTTAAKSGTDDINIAELESLVNESEGKKKQTKPAKVEPKAAAAKANNSGMQQAIGAAATATGTKKLTQEEMAKIAKLVALELAKAQAAQKEKPKENTNKVATSKTAATDSEESLVKSLQEASTDTLQAEKVDVNTKDNSNKAKATSNKKVDTFNKVVVEKNNNADDEFAKLSSEIDSILAQDEVKQDQANKKITSQLQDVVKDREKELRFITVRQGDTLSSLAHRAYGRASAYVKIYKANPELVKNPNRIYVGMKLRVPVDEEYKGNKK